MLIFHSFKASGSTFSRLHHRLLKSFKEAAISLRHLEKSILEGNLYLGPLEMILRTLASGMTFRLPVITCPAEGYKSFEFLQSQEAGVLESISKSFTILLKLNIVDLIGLLYL